MATNKTDLLKFKNLTYGETADFCRCPNCEKNILLPNGMERCPICGEEVVWVDEELQELPSDTPATLIPLSENIYNIPYALATEGERNLLEHALNVAIANMHPSTNERVTLRVETEGGETTYGMEFVEALETTLLVVGMVGNGQVKVFDVDSESEDAVNWLMDDIQWLGQFVYVTIIK